MNEKTVYGSWLLLKITYGMLFIIAGADKFFNFITIWGKYVSSEVLNIIPLELETFLLFVGLFEIALGVFILLPKWTRAGAFVASSWLILIALNLLPLKYYDIAVRDAVMAVGAFVLGMLTIVIHKNNDQDL